jgi:hypothetical protein
MSETFEVARRPSPGGTHDESQSGCSLMVKRQPSKLVTRVRFPSPAPVLSGTVMLVPPKGRHGAGPKAGAPCSSRVGAGGKMSRKDAAVAQSVEHFLGKEEVTGSIPVSSSSLQNRAASGLGAYGAPGRGPAMGRDYPAEIGLIEPMGKRKEFSVHGEG